MTTYFFQTREFGVSDTGLHLLRSGFNYQTIKWSEINSIKIENGKELHHWIIIFAIGAIVLIVGIYLSIRTIDILIYGDLAPRNARIVFFLFVPCVGAYFMYNSLQTGIILRLNYSSGKKDMFPLKEIIGEKKLKEFKSFMKDKLSAKVSTSV